MRLTLYTDLALRLLMLLAVKDDDLTTLPDAARSLSASQNHLNKVALRLVNDGWIESRRGRNGGLRLRQSADQISLGAVVRALEEKSALVSCMPHGTNDCPLVPACRLKPILAKAEEAFLHSLDRHSLAELTQSNPALAVVLGQSPPDTPPTPL